MNGEERTPKRAASVLQHGGIQFALIQEDFFFWCRGRLLLLLLLSLAFCHLRLNGVTAAKHDDNDVNNNFAVAAYLPDYRVTAYMEQQLLLQGNSSSPPVPILTDLILFSLQPHSKGFLGGCCLQPDHYALAQQYREQLYQDDTTTSSLTVWVTVGGAGRSDALRPICADEKLRKRLIQSVVNLWYVCQPISLLAM